MVIGKIGFKVSSSPVSKLHNNFTNNLHFYNLYLHSRSYERVERKKSLRRLTSQWCDEVKSNKLAEYRNELDNQKEMFFKQKLETLEWAKKEEIECGVEPTITDADIERARKQLEEWKILKSIQE